MTVSTNTRCQPKPDWIGPCHEPGGKLLDSRRERGTELLVEIFGGFVAIKVLEHERVGAGELDILRLALDFGQRLPGVGLGVGAAAVGREIEMAEAQSRGLLEQLRVLVEPGLELRVGRPMRRRDVLGEELHLLRHAAADDLVVLVEPQREPLAIKNLFLDLGVDQPVELLRRRLAAPLGLEHRREPRKLIEGQHDLSRRSGAEAAGIAAWFCCWRGVGRIRPAGDTVGAE